MDETMRLALYGIFGGLGIVLYMALLYFLIKVPSRLADIAKILNAMREERYEEENEE